MELVQTFQILLNIIQDIAAAPDGISTSDITDKYGISRRVVPKYINILEQAGIPIYIERKRYYLDESYFAPFTLTPEESEFLYLALERAVFFHQYRWGPMRSLLHKLTGKMTMPLGDLLLSRQDADHPPGSSDRWFSLLAHAKRKRLEVTLTYHPPNRPQPRRWLIRPVRFISNPLSDGLYVLCEGSSDGQQFILLSLKFDRILDVQLTDRRFDIADAARLATYEGRAWGVWSSDRPPTRVTLLFATRHYDRLLETIWHPTQEIMVDDNGDVRFSVTVSEPQEMVPWIRSWGSGVVVMEPDTLRQRIIWSLQRQLQSYGLTAEAAQPDNTMMQLWAKYERRTGAYHVLLYHLLDVAAVAWVMWERVLSESQRIWLQNLLGLDAEGTQLWMALLIGLHDIGKATSSFQRKAEPLFKWLIANGLHNEPFNEPHGLLSALILKNRLAEMGIPLSVSSQLAAVIGGHHGTWISTNRAHKARAAVGGLQWQSLQEQLFQEMVRVLPVSPAQWPEEPTELNQLTVFLSGFTAVCDWIGSHDTYFPYETQPFAADTYFENSRQRAETALSALGWFGWRAPGDHLPFEAVFPFPPNALQKAAMQACNFSAGAPRLVLIEYLTGGGKTELALHLADNLVNLFGQAGVYVAMPTQATSNQMFERFGKYLQARYPDQAINVQLIHAQADQHLLYQQLAAPSSREGDESSLTAATWFQNRKRALLAPFAVGTVDQAMLSVLQVRHHFVRQFALSHKTVIFDEVHAYDTYMNAVVERLLNWLTALESPAIILSATLPRHIQSRLIEQVGGNPAEAAQVPYPRLTIVGANGDVEVHPLPAPTARTLYLHHIGPRIEELCNWLAPIYELGGCFAVICNTVDEAIAAASALCDHPEFNADDILLFHARFPPQWRAVIEQKVLSYFGKTGQRPARMILVATQIIEQSLDLDFDLIVTSTAPIDLLIQRAGRLHRHDDRARPAHLAAPVMAVRQPYTFEGDVPRFGVDEAVYARFILLRTWLILQGRDRLVVPDEMDAVIDFVYHEDTTLQGLSSTYTAALQAAWEAMTLKENGERFRGEMYRISLPDDELLVGGTSYDLSDDDHIRITTRDIGPTIDIICVAETDTALSLPSLPNHPPTSSEIRTLLRYRISIRKGDVVGALSNLPEHSDFRRVPQLRYARPIIFDGDTYTIPNSGYTLKLSHFYGLEIIKE